MNLFDDEYQGCPARVLTEPDIDMWECSLLDRDCHMEVTCHESNCAIYFWLEKFAERVNNGRPD